MLFFDRLLSDEHVDLEDLWFKESKADWVISSEGIRRLFQRFPGMGVFLEIAPTAHHDPLFSTQFATIS
ncbi:hypothetical protein ACFOHS_22725, partial [Jhaorihella thermophila]